MSTITDLFSVRIGFGKKAVFIEQLDRNVNMLIADEKLPIKEGYVFTQHSKVDFEELLGRSDVTARRGSCFGPEGGGEKIAPPGACRLHAAGDYEVKTL